VSYTIVVPVQSYAGFQNGLSVTAWAVSRFANGNVPAEGTAFPSGTADATATTSTQGGPGQAVLVVPNNVAYNICVTDGSGVNWWTQTSEAIGGAAGSAVQSITSSDGSITIGGTSTAPTVALPAAGTAGTYGDSSHTLTITTDAKGRVTAVTANGVSITHSAITDWATALSSALTGYFNTAGSGLSSSGSTVSLPAVGIAGTSGDASHTLAVTVDGYGRVTGITVNTIAIAQSQVTGLTAALATIPNTYVSTFNTRSGAVTLTKADVTGTGLTYSDVGADASGAASAAQTAAQTYADRYAGSAAGTASRPLAATDASVTNSRTPTSHASTHASAGSDPVTIAESQVTNLTTDLAAKAPLASPAFTGTPTAPTPTAGDNSTKLATSAYVDALQLGGLFFNVKAYGAKGDNSTDDTSAINSAIAALISAGGGILYFPAGAYLISAALTTITVACVIEGAGGVAQGASPFYTTSAIVLKNAANCDMLTLAAQGIVVRDLGFFGNNTQQTAASNGIVASTSTKAAYCIIERCWISNFYTDGIVHQLPGGSGSLQWIITDTQVRSCGQYGLNQSSGADSVISNCQFANNNASGCFLAGSITLTDVHNWGNGGGALYTTTVTASSSGNTVTVASVTGIAAGQPFNDTSTPTTAATVLSVNAGTKVVTLTNAVTVTNGNTVTFGTTPPHLDGFYVSGGFTRFTNCESETNVGRGWQLRGNGVQIVGCTAWSNSLNGVYAFNGHDHLISGCKFYNNGTSNVGGQTNAGVELDTCTACTTTGNTFFDTRTTGYGSAGVGMTQSYGYYEVGNTCVGCVFIGNASRSTDHKTGNWIIGASATPTIPSTPANYNAG